MAKHNTEHADLINPAHRARKRFGQNFLVDQNIINKIVSAIHPKADENLVEIGPGQGAMTRGLLEGCPTMRVVELDHDLVPLLEEKFGQYPDFKVYQGDALKTDFQQFQSGSELLRVAGNLPYNISTPLIFHLLEHHDIIRDMHFMLQKEVVERISAEACEKSYGRLSVMVQYFCQIEPLFLVPPSAFRPMPKVDSAIVRLTPHQTLPIVADNYKLFQNLVNACFQQRRKTIRNSLKAFASTEQLETLPVDLKARPETLSVIDFVVLSNALNKL